MSTLNIRVFAESFVFENPPGDQFDCSVLLKSKREAAQELLSRRHPLSAELQRKIKSEIDYQERKGGAVKQFIFGIFLPAGLLLGDTFDMDRDIVPLKNLISSVLGAVFSPSEYRLVESVSEGKFSKDGKVIFKLMF